MALSIEKTAKTVEEAQKAALLELGVAEEDTVLEILEEPSKGLFGFFGRDAKVRVTVKEKAEARPVVSAPAESCPEPAPRREAFRGAAPSEPPTEAEAGALLDKAEAFLRQIFQAMRLDVSMSRGRSDDAYLLSITGEDLGILIGKHGQTLDALQYLVNLAANHGVSDKRVHIVLDIEHYRDRREETLRRLASRLADKVVRTRQRVMLEPMNRHERKVIHMALQEDRRVATYSAGDEPYRKVVIEPGRERRGGYRERRAAEE